MKTLLVIGVIVVLAIPAGFALVGVAFDHTKVKTHSVAGQVREIVVRADSGDVELIRAVGPVQVRETQHYLFRTPRLERDLTGGVLTLETTCSGGFYFTCSADLRVTVPPGIKVTVQADSGDVHANAIDVRDIDAQSDSGNVHLELTGRQTLVDADSDSGDVHLELRGRQALARAHSDSGDIDVVTEAARSIEARTDSGSVHVEAVGRPQRVIARTDSGDVDVRVPAGDYAVDADADSGDLDVRKSIVRDDRAAASIEAHTDSGDVTLRGG
jgi:hypothetical protein